MNFKDTMQSHQTALDDIKIKLEPLLDDLAATADIALEDLTPEQRRVWDRAGALVEAFSTRVKMFMKDWKKFCHD